MTILPLILRELRSEARRPWNYWLRLLAGAAVTSVFVFGVVVSGLRVASNGGMLFGLVSLVLYYGVWFVVPLLTADCLSREKREGTLGLLFLTPLKSQEIVLAKSVVHWLRAMSFLFAAFPVLTIPLLIGGVSGGAVLSLLMGNMANILLALAAGLMASAFAREWIRAVLLAATIAFATFFANRLMVSVAMLPFWGMTVSGPAKTAAVRPLWPSLLPFLNWILPLAISALPFRLLNATCARPV
jgi:ABC-type transport system involved in multi-copper enzyme maturation permease subunit